MCVCSCVCWGEIFFSHPAVILTHTTRLDIGHYYHEEVVLNLVKHTASGSIFSTNTFRCNYYQTENIISMKRLPPTNKNTWPFLVCKYQYECLPKNICNSKDSIWNIYPRLYHFAQEHLLWEWWKRRDSRSFLEFVGRSSTRSEEENQSSNVL